MGKIKTTAVLLMGVMSLAASQSAQAALIDRGRWAPFTTRC